MQYKRLIGTLLLALLLIAPYVNWFYNNSRITKHASKEPEASSRYLLERVLKVKKTSYGFIILRPLNITLAREILARGYRIYPLSGIVVFREAPDSLTARITSGGCCAGWGSDPRLSILLVNVYYKAVYNRMPTPEVSFLVTVYPNNSVGVVVIDGGDSYRLVDAYVKRLKSWYTAKGGVLVITRPGIAKFTGTEYLTLANNTEWNMLRQNNRILVLLLSSRYDSIDLRVYQSLLGVPVSRMDAYRIIGAYYYGRARVLFDNKTPIIIIIKYYNMGAVTHPDGNTSIW